ncbi:unnamed protein product [Leptidea sinapis]|uniref:Kindlin-2 N-terminal domain-containing protein n=1 Tax=Leptidea sinapis TaxID=189913 RepID=A0A5E4Q182_9NEOP|nr:unnamed protein product [Leptidea sinapis]
MLADGEIVGDGSWNLTIYVTDLSQKRTMVVKGDMHIGGVMLKLTESFGLQAKPVPDKQGERVRWLVCWYGIARCAYAAARVLHRRYVIQDGFLSQHRAVTTITI